MDSSRGRAGRPGRKNTLGFTLIELLTVLLIIGVLAGIALPKLQGVLLRARAADVVGDMNVIKVGVLTYHSDHNGWPRDRNRGQIPPELREYLPQGFDFRKEDYVLDYDDWSRKRRSPFNVGVTFISSDQELGLAVLDMLGTNVWTNGRTKFTWIIDG
jgi:prepilin-type N-terminal cleavage/methylation domain-containing protein